MNKINIYIFNQILKYFFLVFFIFLSIAWILQLSRLFSISNFLQLDIINIIYLSIFLIPNILTIIGPFILIFGLLLCFIKLHRDKELIALISLGLELKPITKSLLFFSIFILTIYSLLNFYFAPKIYELYKHKEYDLRNTIDFDSLVFSNFIKLNNNTILDFKKNNDFYEDIYISFSDEKENIIYAKKGLIYKNENNYSFQLSDGFKISVNDINEFEKLEFLNYVFDININSNNNLNINDANTLTLLDNFYNKNYLNISFKFIDVILLIFIIYLFYFNNIKNLNFDAKSNIFFSLICIFILIFNQILKNSEIDLKIYLFSIIITFLLALVLFIIKKRYE